MSSVTSLAVITKKMVTSREVLEQILVLQENPCQHPVIIFRNVKFDDLAALVDFMYQGEVNVVQEQLASFLTTAELLAVQGLSDGNGKDQGSDQPKEVRNALQEM